MTSSGTAAVHTPGTAGGVRFGRDDSAHVAHAARHRS